MKSERIDTIALEWLLEKSGENNGTMINDESIDVNDIKNVNKNDFGFVGDSALELDNNFSLNSSDYTSTQKRNTISNKSVSEKINKVLKNMFNKYVKYNNTYYKDTYEYHGVIESINKNKNKFAAVLVNFNDEDDILSVEFNISDISNYSEREVIDIGVQVIWIIGQESQFIVRNGSFIQGTQQNISKLLIRRSLSLNKKKIKEAKEEANEWSKFFRKFGFEDTSNRE